MSKLLEVTDLSVAYGVSKVLFEINLEVKEDDVVGIVGRNGAGKTTLLKTISGLLKPINGKVVFNGKEINNLPAFKVSRLGIKYVPQDKTVFSRLTAYENLEIALAGISGLRGGKPRKEKIDEVLEIFPRLKVVAPNKASTLSGGEKQMLNIAMALLSSPKLLLLDEPTEGLAPAFISELGESFQKISKETTLVLVEQNIPLVTKLCNKVYALKEGKVAYVEDSREAIAEKRFEAFL
jgi:branched-chain amino acid transport system ATP-binding protein